MTPDELIEIVGMAYGEPTDEIAEELFSLVHRTWHDLDSSEEQAQALLHALTYVRHRLNRVINAVAEIRNAELAEPLEFEDLPF